MGSTENTNPTTSPETPAGATAQPAPADPLAAAKQEAAANYDRYVRSVADLENFRRCQDGVLAPSSDWVWFARGLDTDREDEHGDLVNNGTVELPQRSQYAAWLKLMTEAA